MFIHWSGPWLDRYDDITPTSHFRQNDVRIARAKEA